MSLTLSLTPSGHLQATTPHGLGIVLQQGEAGYNQLVKMLKRQALAKPTPPPGITGDQFNVILAEWERIGPVGAGKKPTPSAQRAEPLSPHVQRYLQAHPRQFQANGKPRLPSLAELELD